MTTCTTSLQANVDSNTFPTPESTIMSNIPLRPKDLARSLLTSLPAPPSPTSASRICHASKPPLGEASSPTDLPNTKAPTLLIVDDNPVNLRLLTMFAKKAGCPHITSADGKLALDAYCSAHKASLLPPEPDSVGIPNVILMDINMPIMDGYESTQRIRHYESKHGLPPAMIIAVSALQSEAAHDEAYGSGFNMFLSKPVKLKQLAQIIRERPE